MPDMSGLIWFVYIAAGAFAAFVVAMIFLLMSVFVTVSFSVAFASMAVAGIAGMAASAMLIK